MGRRGRRSGRPVVRWPAALLLAAVVAQGAVLLMHPRDAGPDPAPVRAAAYFTAAQVERADAFRGPELWLYGASVAVGLAVLALLVRRPPRWTRGRPRRAWVAGAATAAAVSLATAVAALPLAAISRGRAIDVGLVTRSWPGWAWDVALSAAVAAALAAAGGAVLVFALRRFGRGWWAPGAVVVVGFAVVMTYLSPVVLEPLYNEFTPLPNGRTRADVLELARRAGVEVGEVYVIDASRRTTGANAYVAGLGRTKRVVLYDTLLEDFTPAEVRHVVAHELGHVHNADVPHGLLWVAIVAPFGMLAVARLAEALGPADWRERPAAAVPAVALALAVVVPLLTTISNQLSRGVEARADAFALELTRDPATMIAFERRIAVSNVADLTPPGWSTFLLSTHPPTLERIGAAVAFRRAAAEAAARRRTPGGS